ncbi:uncharacterized protein LOC131673005 [Phymastichus coffea]|uniref:uncharacterized protein LOC131673005 n=1 Tax=Phymastichus coffea TaxID=108790 RepID=UPI00273BB62B|nr:uncharacterized protein LOC131673005 [Phymastichus coffea]
MSAITKSNKNEIIVAANRNEETSDREQTLTKRGRGRPKKIENEKKDSSRKNDIRTFMQREKESKEIGFAKSDKLIQSPSKKADEMMYGKIEVDDDEVTEENEQEEEGSEKDGEEKRGENSAEDKSEKTWNEHEVKDAQKLNGKAGQDDKEENEARRKQDRGTDVDTGTSTDTSEDERSSVGEELKKLQDRMEKMEEQRRIYAQAVELAKEMVRLVVEKFDRKMSELINQMVEKAREQKERLEKEIEKMNRCGKSRREERKETNESTKNKSNEMQEEETAQRADDKQHVTTDKSGVDEERTRSA